MLSMGRNPFFIQKAHNYSQFSAQIDCNSHCMKKDKQSLLVQYIEKYFDVPYRLKQ